MHTTITARHCEIPEELRERARAVMERLATIASRPVDGTVVFDESAAGASVELRLHVARGTVYVAIGEAPDHRTALDRAEERLRRQLDKADQGPRPRRAQKGSV